MEKQEKLRLLRSLHLLDQIPEEQLAPLEQFLKPLLLEAGAKIFEEGSRGGSLYFISSGAIRISKKVSDALSKDLAILGPGDCFGEMALLDDTPRSATAWAAEPAVVFELGRADLNLWLKSHPELAMGFFAELVQLQTRRLRRTSNELTLLYDLSNFLLDQTLTGKELLAKILDHVVPHLEGTWSAAAYLYNLYNEEMDFVASVGSREFGEKADKMPSERRNAWADSSTYHVFLPEQKRPLGYLVFQSHASLASEERNEKARTLTTVSRLVTAALDNINYRTEQSLRARLKEAQTHGGL